MNVCALYTFTRSSMTVNCQSSQLSCVVCAFQKRKDTNRFPAFLRETNFNAKNMFHYYKLSISASDPLNGQSKKTRVVVSVSTSRSRDVSTSRLEKNCQRLSLVSVSAIYVSCPRPIFGQIVQATVCSVNAL